MNVGGSDHGSGENKKQTQRKTKWGADLIQDAYVRKLRASTYQVSLSDLKQTRVDQITQHLRSGILDIGNNENMPSTHQNSYHISSSGQRAGNEQEGRGKQISSICCSWF